MASNPGDEHWRQLEIFFNAAMDADPLQRGELLDRFCGEHPTLCEEARDLLRSSEETWGFLDDPLREAAQHITSSPELTGQEIGAYRIVHLLGEGGMGRVYLADRADDLYQQQVAIKLVQTGAGRYRDLLLRFSAERRILANLVHPCIARLLDAGITPDGLPYLVMEYVEGIPIDLFAAEHRLSINQRLELFRDVCSAVEYAHRNLVVHRDIKPANILVTAVGSPKLLDFGIAKLLQSHEVSGEFPTRETERLMTPEYASPEQVRGQAITTSTDVYALGGLLFTLLTGRPPLRIQSSDPLEVARVICEQEATRPSLALRQHAEPSHNSREKLSGDLDRIVLKALRKEPEKRYASVADLSEDVRRYLEGYPLQAGSNAWSYRTYKFIHRHWIGVTTTVLMILAILGFSVGMAVLARRAREERANAIQQQHKAEQEAEFLSGLFQAATPDAERGKTITARDVLDLSAARIHRELNSEPEVRAAMLNSVGNSYLALGLYDEAQPLLEEAYSLRKSGDPTLSLAESAASLADARRDQGQFGAEETLLREALGLRRTLAGTNRLLLADTLSNLGECLYLQSRTKEAEPVLREAVAQSPKDTQVLAGAENYLALVLENTGSFEEAAKLLRSATDISAHNSGTDSTDYLTALHNLAGALSDLGNLAAAESAERQVLAIRERVSGKEHPDTIYSLNNLGWILLEKGDWVAAEPYLKRAVELNRKQLGDKHPRMAVSLNNWARVLQAKGDYAEAERIYLQSLALLEENHQADSWPAAKIEANLSALQLDRRRYTDAERYARQALELRRKLGGDENPDVASSLIDAGLAQAFQGDLTGAEQNMRLALEIRKRIFNPSHPRVLAAQVRLGEVLLRENRLKEAESILRDARHAAGQSAFPLLPWQIAEAQNALGACLFLEGERTEGSAFLRGSYEPLRTYPQAALRTAALERSTRLLASGH